VVVVVVEPVMPASARSSVRTTSSLSWRRRTRLRARRRGGRGVAGRL